MDDSTGSLLHVGDHSAQCFFHDNAAQNESCDKGLACRISINLALARIASVVWAILRDDCGTGWAWKKASISSAFSREQNPPAHMTMTASIKEGLALPNMPWM